MHIRSSDGSSDLSQAFSDLALPGLEIFRIALLPGKYLMLTVLGASSRATGSAAIVEWVICFSRYQQIELDIDTENPLRITDQQVGIASVEPACISGERSYQFMLSLAGGSISVIAPEFTSSCVRLTPLRQDDVQEG